MNDGEVRPAAPVHQVPVKRLVPEDGRWVERHKRPPVLVGRRMMKICGGGCNLESVAPGIVREPLASLPPEWRPDHATSRQRSLWLRSDGRGRSVAVQNTRTNPPSAR